MKVYLRLNLVGQRCRGGELMRHKNEAMERAMGGVRECRECRERRRVEGEGERPASGRERWPSARDERGGLLRSVFPSSKGASPCHFCRIFHFLSNKLQIPSHFNIFCCRIVVVSSQLAAQCHMI
jgi:hypothetical protein